MSDNKYDYVIYHKNCLDGFSGYFILTTTNTTTENAFVYPDVPSSNYVPPNIEGKNIIIIDVAYKKNILLEIIKKSKKTTFIDHHVSIRNDIMGLNIGSPHEIIYDENESGASLVWNYFYKNKKMPRLISYVKDNDIGAWKKKWTFPFIAAISVHYQLIPTVENILKWNKLLDDEEIKRLIKKGKVYNEYKEFLIKDNMKRYSLEKFPGEKLYNNNKNFFTKIGQYKVIVQNGPGCPSSSHLSISFLDKIECDFVIFWVLNMDRKEYVIQFRSKSVDVGEIAKLFGGGGHKLASACSIPISRYDITDMFMPNSLPREN